MIKLSTGCRYGTRILLFLASGEADRPARRHEISKAEGVSLHYVEQILLKLRSAGLVTSRRGVNGGFVLARDPADITIADVFRATEGGFDLVPCLKENCRKVKTCVTKTVWDRATAALYEVLSGTTLQDMVEQSYGKKQKRRNNRGA